MKRSLTDDSPNGRSNRQRILAITNHLTIKDKTDRYRVQASSRCINSHGQSRRYQNELQLISAKPQ